MVPVISSHEQLALEHGPSLRCEAQQERLLAEGQHALPHVAREGDSR